MPDTPTNIQIEQYHLEPAEGSGLHEWTLRSITQLSTGNIEVYSFHHVPSLRTFQAYIPNRDSGQWRAMRAWDKLGQWVRNHFNRDAEVLTQATRPKFKTPNKKLNDDARQDLLLDYDACDGDLPVAAGVPADTGSAGGQPTDAARLRAEEERIAQLERARQSFIADYLQSATPFEPISYTGTTQWVNLPSGADGS